MKWLAGLVIFITSVLAGCAHIARKPNYHEQGLASWYGARLHGHKTASGERFDMHSLTAAHHTLPMGTRISVKSLTTGKVVVVRINDRGPQDPSRILDLSSAAAGRLGMLKAGTDQVVVDVVD